jgi:BTB/POZ domain
MNSDQSHSLEMQRFVLNVGGRRFETTRATLLGHRESTAKHDSEKGHEEMHFFSALLRHRSGGEGIDEDKAADNSEIFIDRDPAAFAVLLDFLRTGDLRIPASPSDFDRVVAREAAFFGVQVPQLAKLGIAGVSSGGAGAGFGVAANSAAGGEDGSLGGLSLSDSGSRVLRRSTVLQPRTDGVYYAERSQYFLSFDRPEGGDSSKESGDGSTDLATAEESRRQSRRSSAFWSRGFDSSRDEEFAWKARDDAAVLDLQYSSSDVVTYSAGGARQRARDVSVRHKHKLSLLWDAGTLLDADGAQLHFLPTGDVLQGVTFTFDAHRDDAPSDIPGMDVSSQERILMIRFPFPMAAGNNGGDAEEAAVSVAVLFEAEGKRSWAVFPGSTGTMLLGENPGLVVRRFFMTASNLEIVPLGGHLLARMSSDARTLPWRRFTIDQ